MKPFMNDLRYKFFQRNSSFNTTPFQVLRETIGVTLKETCTFKKKTFTNKRISKETGKRSHLRNRFLNTKSEIDWKAYNKQRNLCINLMLWIPFFLLIMFSG